MERYSNAAQGRRSPTYTSYVDDSVTDDEYVSLKVTANYRKQFNNQRCNHRVYLNQILEPSERVSDVNIEQSSQYDDEEESDAGLHDVYINEVYSESRPNTPIEQRRYKKASSNEEYETSQDESIPSSARSLNRRIRRKASDRKYTSFKAIALSKDSPSMTNLFENNTDLNDYAEVINYYRKESLDEGFIEDESNTTESEPSVQNQNLNCTFETTLINRNDKSFSSDKLSPKRSIGSAILNQTRHLKRSRGPLKGLTRMLGNLRTSESSDPDELTESETNWQFVVVPEAPRPPIIIPGDQLSAWTPARYCKVSVRAGKVRHMIDYFNKMPDHTNDVNYGLEQHPCMRHHEIRICPGTYPESRKIIQKFLQEARLPKESQAKKERRPSLWKRVRSAVFRKD